MKKSHINFTVDLDDKNVPEKITWSASDKPDSKMEETKSMSISLWDHTQKNTMRIDLWSKDMPVDEMKTFILQTFLSMKQSISKATSEENLVNLIEDFCIEFEKRISNKSK